MPCDTGHILAALSARARESRDPDALAAALVAAVKDALPQASWAGVYWLREGELVLGPFVGPPTEHTRIPVGRGVCGTAIATGEDQVVEDVREVANYLSCSPTVRSEAVVLIRSQGRVVGQLDVDSEAIGAFGEDEYCVLRTVADGFGGLLEPAR
jgi:GAF domain-containing protein